VTRKISTNPRVYLLCYTIARDASYGVRHASLRRAVEQEAKGPIWSKLTSTVLMKSKRSVGDLLTTLYMKSEISESRGDRVLVVDVTDRPNARIGLPNPELLASFLPEYMREPDLLIAEAVSG
jgi:hypothetical protein